MRGVRYERAAEVIYVSRANALKLIRDGKAVEDTCRSNVLSALRRGQVVTAAQWRKFAIREKFRQLPLGNCKHHAVETFDHFEVAVLIHPITRMKICPANEPKPRNMAAFRAVFEEWGLNPAEAMDRRGAPIAETRPGGRQRIVVPLAEGTLIE